MTAVELEKVRNAIKGNKNAFAELMDERKKDIYRIAFIYVKNNLDAMDLFHDTVYNAFATIKKLKNPEFFNTWITRITINCCINFLKKKKRINKNEIQCIDSDDIYQYSDGTPDLSEVLSSNIDLIEAIEKLDIKLKTVILLKYYQDFTINQVAEIVECPIGTVKTRLNRALSLLRLELKDVKGGNFNE
ncbi:RNA polymerase, sigma-24 subunit, ECF subfamily [Ruminiclostridium papyrosolvens DSM 2782]|uniref:RNA polymerase, sigma-24 subunit, ECF subfamily n=1 Tax=Ruminiclostridium papyrosolvens DSM 2782 TaxID=588581 RepID=F1TFI3_9FIRM|nr:sigma-70 family RNA polymerase sigma factor [Ruminiclostridium papyrosolvens]EGD46715.1 RNA polymerase, sigma-24 subunit, ECF subfamily [Ruminiclostridium papyrosolvens DSM 2782]WES34941.1 sigma-70 family RNA polymerase sigma factor [Ruminiclostridium papyrosolvens DSM 2782]